MDIKTAHECPISILDSVGNLTDYDYALVHHFPDNESYFNYFKNAIHAEREVFLDNSIFELGTSFDPKEYVPWIEKLSPTLYIAPDVLEDGIQTAKNFRDWKNTYGSNNLPGLVMGAVQGKTYDEIVYCYKFMAQQADYIALSFDFSYYMFTGFGSTKAQRRCSGRQRLIQHLIDDGIWEWNKPHHLLGCSLVNEYKWYVNNNVYNIRSCDTSNPVIAGLMGKSYNSSFGLADELHLADHEDLITKEVTDDQFEVIMYNIDKFKENCHTQM